jgi:uncharacterized membrane protein YqjE
MSDPLLEEMEEMREIMEEGSQKMSNNLTMKIISTGFTPLMTVLTLYQISPPNGFKYLLLAQTILIILFTLVPIYSLANARNSPNFETIKEFMQKKSVENIQVSWLDLVPEICMQIVTICSAIVIYNTSMEIAILLIFNRAYAYFSIYIIAKVDKIFCES